MNGYDPSNAILVPHAVDPDLHHVIEESHPSMQYLLNRLRETGKYIDYKSAVIFCGRYWDKKTYTKKKLRESF